MRPCDLTDSIAVDGESVTFTLSRPDSALPFKLALPMAFPVPADTPSEDQGFDPLPATGPYVVETASKEVVHLVRNDAFREWSGAAQPEGFLDEITFRFDAPPVDAFDRLEAGEVDVMLETPVPEDLDALRSQHPDRVASWPAASTFFIGFDVLRPPFDDERVRQALAYAIDRDHIVDLLGGPAAIGRPARIVRRRRSRGTPRSVRSRSHRRRTRGPRRTPSVHRS